jgi:hypothetical protein
MAIYLTLNFAGGLYGQMSYDLDEFTFDHPDFLVLFAGGNFGSEGTKSIISPANAKNVLTVGAGQVDWRCSYL